MILLPWLLFLYVLLATSPALALPKGCTGGPDGICAVPIVAGDRAPFTGQLLTTELALQLGSAADDCKSRDKLEVERCLEDAKIDLDTERTARTSDNRAFEGQLKQLQEQLARAQKVAEESAPPFYAQPWFVAPVVAIITGGVMVWALHH